MTAILQRATVMLLLGGAMVLGAPQLGVSQDLSEDMLTGLEEGAGAASVNDYGRPGYPRVRIYLWGNAQNGVWTVEEGTDLLEFLSAAAEGDFNSRPDTRVKNMLRIYRKGQIGGEPAFSMKMERIFSRQVETPALQDGDVLVVESIQRRRFFSFRNLSRVLGTVTSVISLVLLIAQ